MRRLAKTGELAEGRGGWCVALRGVALRRCGRTGFGTDWVRGVAARGFQGGAM